MTTQHNDLNRTGANPSETILNTSNVSVNTFGKLFSHAVDGQIYAQPLYVPSVQIPGQGTHNVVFICTEGNSVYAFDADNAAAWAPLWRVNFGPTTSAVFDSVQPQVGITSTPVIDTTSGTLYVVDNTVLNSASVYQLHALDITTGNEKFNGPVTIQGSVSGTGDGSNSGTLTFNPSLHFQRPGLLLSNGKVYVAFGSHGNDQVPWHGWIFAFSASTLQQTSLLCLTPNGNGGGVWTGGMGLAADASGNLFISTGNGTFDANSGGTDYGDSIAKVSTASGLAVSDYFAPSNQSTLDIADADLGSTGPILIPGSSRVVEGGKEGKVFVLDQANLGHFNSTTDQVVQEWQATTNLLATGQGGSFGTDWVYYNSTLYLWGNSDFLRAFSFNGSTFNTTPVSVGTIQAPAMANPYGYSSEPSMSLSANGTTAGSAIIWAAYSASGDSDGYPHPGILHAFDAADLTKDLWNSGLNSSRDDAGSWAKWSAPTIANGKVYLATFDGAFNVFGLLSPGGGSLVGTGDSSQTGANLTLEGATDWVHWGDTTLNRKANVTAQISTYSTVAPGTVSIANVDPRPLSWTDGAPTASSTNNTDYAYIGGVGNGFSLIAPADATTRTLILHVGGWSSGGTLTAHLSDGSAPDFTDTTANTSGQYDRNYTLTYNAAGPNQALTVSWVVTSGGGSVHISGAALSGGSTTPMGNITATAGTPQSATVGTVFATALQATVRDASNNPVSGATVTFTAPGSGASGTFNGSSTVTTNSSGVATAPTFTANSVAGSYTVTASVSGITTPASFSLTNTATVSGGGALSGVGNSNTTAASLTTEGTSDWVHWGDGSLNRKANVTAQLSTYSTLAAGTVSTATVDLRPLSWTDGAPTASSTNNTDYAYIGGVGNGFSFTAPADTSIRTLVVHVGGWHSGGTLTAHLSDGSAPDFTDTTASTSGQYDRNYTLTYNAAGPNQALTVSWVMASGGGSVHDQRGGAFGRKHYTDGNRYGDGWDAAERDGGDRVRDCSAGHGSGCQQQSGERRDGDIHGPGQRRQRNVQWFLDGDHQQQRRGHGPNLHR